MRVTIIVEENRVNLEGQSETEDCSSLMAEDVHAVKWYGPSEYFNAPGSTSLKGNVAITDFMPYQKFVEGQALRRLVQESQAAIDPAIWYVPRNPDQALGEQDGRDVVRFSSHGRPGKIAFDIQVC